MVFHEFGSLTIHKTVVTTVLSWIFNDNLFNHRRLLKIIMKGISERIEFLIKGEHLEQGVKQIGTTIAYIVVGSFGIICIIQPNS